MDMKLPRLFYTYMRMLDEKDRREEKRKEAESKTRKKTGSSPTSLNK